MSSVNKATLLGNVGQEPSVRYTAAGDEVVNLSMATSDKWTDKNTGDRQEKTEWHRVVFFGNIAKVAAKYIHKGSKIYVEGKLQTRKWTDKEGVERWNTEIVLTGWNSQLVLLTPKKDGDPGRYQEGDGHGPKAAAPSDVVSDDDMFPQDKGAQTAGKKPDDFDDDIPF